MKQFWKKAVSLTAAAMLPLSLSTTALAASEDSGLAQFSVPLLILAVVCFLLCIVMLIYTIRLRKQLAAAQKPAAPVPQQIPVAPKKPAAQPQVEFEEQDILASMEAALANGDFQFYLQPQVDQFSKRIIGAEALVRWVHPDIGLIVPGTFMPTIEKSGFVTELDRYILRKVCIYQRDRLEKGKPVVPISVNLALADLADDMLTDYLRSLLAEYRMPANLIRLEVAISVFESSGAEILAVLEKLRTLGIPVEIDDFGQTGFDSIETIQELPTGSVKLDVRSLSSDDPEELRKLSSVLRMGHIGTKSILLEGIETEEQANYFKYIGFRVAQGYLYHKPMPTKDFDRLLNAQKPE